jgi:hypothetical protein
MDYSRIRVFLYVICLSLMGPSIDAYAQEGKAIDTVMDFKVRVSQPSRFYLGSGIDFAMLSTAFVTSPGENMKLTAPRFTAFNVGLIVSYDLNEKMGLFTGLGIKNIGFVDRSGDSTIKRRVYALGIPVGIKIGDLRNRNYLILGGGVDFPFHYREKRYVKRGHKFKYGDWFGEQTPRVMPYIFAGMSFNPGVILKLQYYPVNFLNESFREEYYNHFPPGYTTPYAGTKVNLLIFTLGIDIHYNQYRIQEREYREMRRKRSAGLQ